MMTFASSNSFNLFYLRYCTYWKFIGAELSDKFRFLFSRSDAGCKKMQKTQKNDERFARMRKV